MNDPTMLEVLEALSKLLSENPKHVYAWHSNITKACTDSIHDDFTLSVTLEDSRRIGRVCASRFLKMYLNIDT